MFGDREGVDDRNHLLVQMFEALEGAVVPGGGGDRRRFFKDVGEGGGEFGFGQVVELSEGDGHGELQVSCR